MRKLHLVPPSSKVMAILYAEFLRTGREQGLNYRQFLKSKGYTNPAENVQGMDDSLRFRGTANGPELISIPSQPIEGQMQIKVLLIDFPDRAGTLPLSHYEDLLFSKGSLPTGSMRDYYQEVSLNKVDVTGSIHGWLRMPQPYSFYTNGESGGEWDSYPRNAPRMAEDAVRVALDIGVTFDPNLDLLNQGIVSALFIVHAGRGAEELHPDIRGNDIWSHKWNLRHPIEVAPNLFVTIYLTVPHDAKIGVCAHELGHLAFQWEDFYDPNYDEDGKEWDGSGEWDLMAGGSYNGDGQRPAHPAALHKSQHHWIEVEEVRQSKSLTVNPYTSTLGKAFKLVSPKYRAGQYLMLENRSKVGFDTHLPGEGLLVWRVDETKKMFTPEKPALLLIQADGRHQLETPADWNAGDVGDPFPGSTDRTDLGDTGNISTSYPDGDRSGITLKNIHQDPDTKLITLDVDFDGAEEDLPPEEETIVIEGMATPNHQIPDNKRTGVESTIRLSGEGAVRDITVAVDITHSYIGDLQVELTSPAGQRAVLHNRTGGGTANLQKTYRSSSNSALASLSDTPVSGDWILRVVDLARHDTGTLKRWKLAVEIQKAAASIHKERTPNLPIPDKDASGVSSTIQVSRAGRVRSVKLGVNITHTYRGDLRVELINPLGDRAILHNRTGGGTHDLKETYQSSETASLAGFTGQPVKGDWVLRVSDLAGQDVGTLNHWSLDIELAPIFQVVKQEASPNLSIPDNDGGGIGSPLAIAHSGTAQAIEVSVEITHSYVGDLRVELVAPSGDQATLHSRTGGRTRNLALDLHSESSPELAGLIGQPIKGNWILRVTDVAAYDVGTFDSWSLQISYVT